MIIIMTVMLTLYAVMFILMHTVTLYFIYAVMRLYHHYYKNHYDHDLDAVCRDVYSDAYRHAVL